VLQRLVELMVVVGGNPGTRWVQKVTAGIAGPTAVGQGQRCSAEGVDSRCWGRGERRGRLQKNASKNHKQKIKFIQKSIKNPKNLIFILCFLLNYLINLIFENIIYIFLAIISFIFKMQNKPRSRPSSASF
jgi:hypothetical protein